MSTKVAIVETDVFGVKAYHAKCLGCGWMTKRFNRQNTAVKHARDHRCVLPISAKVTLDGGDVLSYCQQAKAPGWYVGIVLDGPRKGERFPFHQDVVSKVEEM